MKKALLAAVILSALLAGCAVDPVAKYYQDLTKQMPVSFQQRLSNKDFIGDLPAFAGQKVAMKIIRGGKTFDIDVQLNGND